LIFLAFISPTKSFADCPSYSMKCPKNDNTHWDTCFSWGTCKPCGKKLETINTRCDDGCPPNHEEWVKRGDGCSASIFKKGVDKLFNQACNLHDMCYSTPGAEKSTCDFQFLKNTTEECNYYATLGTPPAACYEVASAAYAAVVTLGNPSFEGGKKWANENCKAKAGISAEKKVKRQPKFGVLSKETLEKMEEYAKSPNEIINFKMTDEQKQKFVEELNKIKSEQRMQ